MLSNVCCLNSEMIARNFSIFLAPDDDVLVSVQSGTRRFETVSKSYRREVIHCKYILQGYARLFTFVTYSLIGML